MNWESVKKLYDYDYDIVQCVMLNSFQHLIKSTSYETLNQVQGDTKRFGQHALKVKHLPNNQKLAFT